MSDCSNEKKIVYIWDMDETLILFSSLLDGTYAKAFNGSKDVQKGIEIGKMWEKYILDLKDENQPFCHALIDFDDGKDLSNYNFNQQGNRYLSYKDTTYRLRVIAHKYKQGLHSILDEKTITLCNDLYTHTDIYTDGWLSSARTFVQQCSGHTESTPLPKANDKESILHINVLVTAGWLIPTLAKCLLFKLDTFFTLENVYSSWRDGKLECFKWIKDRFPGPNVQFCVIGDGEIEAEAAETLKWPFVKIEPRPDGIHRFPGLTLSHLNHYLALVYGPSDTDQKEVNV